MIAARPVTRLACQFHARLAVPGGPIPVWNAETWQSDHFPSRQGSGNAKKTTDEQPLQVVWTRPLVFLITRNTADSRRRQQRGTTDGDHSSQHRVSTDAAHHQTMSRYERCPVIPVSRRVREVLERTRCAGDLPGVSRIPPSAFKMSTKPNVDKFTIQEILRSHSTPMDFGLIMLG